MRSFFVLGILLAGLLCPHSHAWAQGGIGNAPSVTGSGNLGATPADKNQVYDNGVKADNAMLILLSLPPEIRSLILPRALLLQLTSQIAAEKASDAQVKTYAQTILDERSPFSQQLMPFHSTNDVQTLIYKEVPGFRDTIKRLTMAKAGVDFDKKYVGSQMEIMEELRIDLEAYLAQPTSVKEDPNARLWAGNFVATMKTPAGNARDLYKKLTKPEPAIDTKPGAEAKQ